MYESKLSAAFARGMLARMINTHRYLDGIQQVSGWTLPSPIQIYVPGDALSETQREALEPLRPADVPASYYLASIDPAKYLTFTGMMQGPGDPRAVLYGPAGPMLAFTPKEENAVAAIYGHPNGGPLGDGPLNDQGLLSVQDAFAYHDSDGAEYETLQYYPGTIGMPPTLLRAGLLTLSGLNGPFAYDRVLQAVSAADNEFNLAAHVIEGEPQLGAPVFALTAEGGEITTIRAGVYLIMSGTEGGKTRFLREVIRPAMEAAGRLLPIVEVGEPYLLSLDGNAPGFFFRAASACLTATGALGIDAARFYQVHGGGPAATKGLSRMIQANLPGWTKWCIINNTVIFIVTHTVAYGSTTAEALELAKEYSATASGMFYLQSHDRSQGRFSVNQSVRRPPEERGRTATDVRYLVGAASARQFFPAAAAPSGRGYSMAMNPALLTRTQEAQRKIEEVLRRQKTP